MATALSVELTRQWAQEIQVFLKHVKDKFLPHLLDRLCSSAGHPTVSGTHDQESNVWGHDNQWSCGVEQPWNCGLQGSEESDKDKWQTAPPSRE